MTDSYITKLRSCCHWVACLLSVVSQCSLSFEMSPLIQVATRVIASSGCLAFWHLQALNIALFLSPVLPMFCLAPYRVFTSVFSYTEPNRCKLQNAATRRSCPILKFSPIQTIRCGLMGCRLSWKRS
ncbi:hypothetical protein BS17DRAFT_119332 [Gyrodon lividus]|nr:hypothetical protein BS17DRAFT_119332 [Gyrodon lividus]